MNFIVGSEKRFSEFMSNLNDKDKVAIISHNDPDGICSNAIISKVVGNIDLNFITSYSSNMLDILIPQFKSKKINKLIITDLNLDPDAVKELEKFAEILIIDHHRFEIDLNSSRTIFLAAESEFPASYICYKLFSKIQSLPVWIAAIGTYGDLSYKYPNSNEIFDDYELGNSIQNLKNITFSTNNALIYFREREKEVYDIVMKARTIDDLKDLEKYSEPVEKEIDRMLNDFENNSEKHRDLIYYYYTPKFSISSVISTVLSSKSENFHKTVIIASLSEKIIRISARRQDRKVDLPVLLKRAVEGIPDSTAGGHVAAAGANFPAEYAEIFKENLLRAYSESN